MKATKNMEFKENKSREQILKSISDLQKPETALPQISDFRGFDDPLRKFINLALESSAVIEMDGDMNLEKYVNDNYPEEAFVVDAGEELNLSPTQLEGIDLAIVQGSFGVAENGAVWVDEKDMKYRILPFIAQHLILKLDRRSVVSNMHQAYGMISPGPGFGVFIAGPSKTADIEQALIVGAHGPRSLTIALY